LDSHFASFLFRINGSAAERLGATTTAVTVKHTYIIAPFLAKRTSNREQVTVPNVHRKGIGKKEPALTPLI
jgi:hypothetical protein